MRDPLEGLTVDGMIRTGVRRERVSGEFEAALNAAVEAVSELPVGLHLYGSVATGMARHGRSDVDLLAIGMSREQAAAIGQQLSRRFADVCRGVEISAGVVEDFHGEDDERFGNRVFLRHYCVSVTGPQASCSDGPFRGDGRAARGFNGDIGVWFDRWRRNPGQAPLHQLGRKVARKTLLAVAGLVSVHDECWTTDREGSAFRWSEVDPRWSASLDRLSSWSRGDRDANATELAETLASDGIVAAIVQRFAADIGLRQSAR